MPSAETAARTAKVRATTPLSPAPVPQDGHDGSATRTHGDAVAGLVTLARNGDQQAWNALVQRYAPLVWAICRRRRLGREDAGDVSQIVWLRLASRLAAIREPAALPGWLATTTARECDRLQRARHDLPLDGPGPGAWQRADPPAAPPEREVMAAERRAALREAFTSLPPRDQRLLAALSHDPPLTDAEISARLGIPVGSIGPARARCLRRLRRHPALAALIHADPAA